MIETEASGIAQAVRDIELRLDRSIEASYERWTIDGARPVDLRQIDFAALEKRFKQGHQHIEIEQLRAMIRRSLERLVPRNRSRMDFYDAFQKMIADYNAGATNAETVFAQLVDFAKQLNEEERRGIREQLDDEQLAILDILTRPSPPLTKQEREQVKRLARELLDTLKAERLVLPQVAQPTADSCRCARRHSGSAGKPAAEILRRRLSREVQRRLSARV